MPGERQKTAQIVWHRVSLVERFSSVLYPLDILELLKQLPNLGYVVPELVLRGTPETGKPIATRGDIELVINQENKTIGVSGRDTKRIMESFEELRAFYKDQMDPSPGLATYYLEFDGQGWAKSEANPTEVCSKFWADYAKLEILSTLLDEEVTNFGIQLVPPNKDPNDPRWFHIYVEPLVVSSNRRYGLRCIWRDPDTEKLLRRFAEIDEILQKLISKLEGKSNVS